MGNHRLLDRRRSGPGRDLVDHGANSDSGHVITTHCTTTNVRGTHAGRGWRVLRPPSRFTADGRLYLIYGDGT